jgi:hypothetical protein
LGKTVDKLMEEMNKNVEKDKVDNLNSKEVK